MSADLSGDPTLLDAIIVNEMDSVPVAAPAVLAMPA